MKGINAYYLLVEAWRHAHRSRGHNRRTLVREYLNEKLKLPEVQARCGINTVRYWAFNDYPDLEGMVTPGATDGRLWKTSSAPEPESFEILGHLTELLAESGFMLVPCLSNYWPSYGGILQYLVWAGEIEQQEYVSAVCENHTGKLYEENTLRFFTSPRVEEIFQIHARRVLDLFSGQKAVKIIEIMNEPRCKNPLSLRNRPLADGRMSSDITAAWLNRQAKCIRQLLETSSKGHMPYISSGEEGWLEKSLNDMNLRALTRQGQSYEGIDLLKDISASPQAINIASIHIYPHKVVKLEKKNICGNDFVDQRGWAHMLSKQARGDKKEFMLMADEWIVSRAKVLKGHPWYIGEMGWCWPANAASRPMSAAALVPERRMLYRRWTELARRHGAKGAFVWMLDGIEHRDEFYGMDIDELSSVMRD